MGIHLHLPRLASCLFWRIAKSGVNLELAISPSVDDAWLAPCLCTSVLPEPRNKADNTLRPIAESGFDTVFCKPPNSPTQIWLYQTRQTNPFR